MQLYKRKTITTNFMANIKVQNIDLKVKEVAIVVTVVPVTLQNIVQLMAKLVTIVIRKDTSKPLCRSCQHSQSRSRWKGSQSQSGRDQHEISSHDQTDDSSWYTCEQDSILIVYNKGNHGNISNICFDEIDGQNCSRVLANLTLCKAQGPKNCHMTNFENFQGIQHRFKLDSGACVNLLPLKIIQKNSFHMSPDKRCLGQLITECNCYPTIRKKYISMVCVIYM